MTQVLTGHGCFGEYLCRIGKERTAECHHCGHPHDSAQHTLESCSVWAAERADLTAAVGADLSLPTVIRAMVGSGEAWKAMSSFCSKVMLQKEDAERERRGRGRRRGASPNPPRDGGMPLPDGGPPPRGIAPTALPRTSMGEDDLDRGRGAANAIFPPLAEERGGCRSGESLDSP